jgi:hypothetical protein
MGPLVGVMQLSPSEPEFRGSFRDQEAPHPSGSWKILVGGILRRRGGQATPESKRRTPGDAGEGDRNAGVWLRSLW